jgi:hypothetical protein
MPHLYIFFNITIEGPSEYISSPPNTGEKPNHQSFIPNPLRKSKQYLTAHQFFNAHKSRMGIPILTVSVANASMRRCLSNRNLSPAHTHTHTSDLQLFEIYQDAIEQSNVQIKPLTQCKQWFSPPFGPQTRAEVSHHEK